MGFDVRTLSVISLVRVVLIDSGIVHQLFSHKEVLESTYVRKFVA